MALIYTDGYFILRAAQLNQVVRYPFICGFLCHLWDNALIDPNGKIIDLWSGYGKGMLENKLKRFENIWP